MNVREARESDAESVAVLSEQLGYPMDADTARGRLAARQPGRAVLVAEGPRGIVGMAEVQLRELVIAARHAELTALVVDESERGRGAGAALLAAAEDWARAQGAAALRLRSNVIRERAHAFYRRAGYRVTKTQHAFARDL
jgi:GNAT superfamily N-acetyltransferase